MNEEKEGFARRLSNANIFNIVFKNQYPSLISKTAYESQLEQIRNKTVKLPSTDDLSKFIKYLESRRNESLSHPKIHFKWMLGLHY